jgi:hypothetical protein
LGVKSGPRCCSRELSAYEGLQTEASGARAKQTGLPTFAYLDLITLPVRDLPGRLTRGKPYLTTLLACDILTLDYSSIVVWGSR